MIRRALLVILFFAGYASANTVNLQWNANAEADVTGYFVFRSTVSGMYNFSLPLNTSPVPQPPAGGPVQFQDKTPTNAVFFYVVKAINTAGVQSPASNEAIANALGPSAPTGLTVTSVTASLNLFVEKVLVAQGSPPLMYTIPRQTPPRSYAILITMQ